MNVEIITIGDELLIGQVVDTNSAWMGKKLNEAGFNISHKSVISDKKEQIISSLDEALKRVDVVLLTGGLGPTKDDVTKEALCEYFDTTLEFNQDVYNDVRAFLSHRSMELVELNKEQAMVPRDCTIIRNTVGTAPIMWFKKRSKSVISMPGVPLEMKTVMRNSIIPKLSREFAKSHILHKTLAVYGLPESQLAEIIKDWEAQLPSYMNLAYLPLPRKGQIKTYRQGNFY
jgi:nicotinamide-nucleotide amidase